MSTIAFDLKCAFCSTNLSGIDLEGACPVCTREIRETLDRGYVDRDSLTVSANVPCIQCEYNLRTLKISSVCPECAKPVADSLKSSRLCFANVLYLQEIRTAVKLLLVALLLPIALIAICSIMAGLITLVNLLQSAAIALTLLVVATSFVSFVCCFSCGAIFICRTEPGRSYPWYLKNLSVIASVFSAATFLSFVIIPIAPDIDWVWYVCILLFVMLTIGCVCLNIRYIAHRAEDHWLRLLSTIYLVCMGMTVVPLAVFSTYMGLTSGKVGVVFLAILPWGFMACYLLSLLILVRCYRMLKREMKDRTKA